MLWQPQSELEPSKSMHVEWKACFFTEMNNWILTQHVHEDMSLKSQHMDWVNLAMFS